MRLFVARARAVSPSFALSPEMAPAVAGSAGAWTGCPWRSSWPRPGASLLPPALLARIEATAGALPLLAGAERCPGPAPDPARAWATPDPAGADSAAPSLGVRRGFGLSAAEAVG